MALPEHLLSFERVLADKKILVTGHTGFTGSWACLWLNAIGARLSGYALPPATQPSLYTALSIEQAITAELGDINDEARLNALFERVQPDLVLHLAAQPLVRHSYRDPVFTFRTNVMGTAHVLEAARHTPSVKGVLCITTDKVYRTLPAPARPFVENDPLGGNDPYSASKSATEHVIHSYQVSYGNTQQGGLAIAAARGGNIIGGGDWSEDRLIPDYVRAVVAQTPLTVRYPQATRPWQHVLALVQGYLMLLAGLLKQPERYAKAWNLGPQDDKSFSVQALLERISCYWTAPHIEYMAQPLSETQILELDSSLAKQELGWVTPWKTEDVIAKTAQWYQGFYQHNVDAETLCLSQLDAWRSDLRKIIG